MSEEPTQEMSQKYDTKPTIETVLERMEAMRSDIMEAVRSEIKAVRVEMQVGFDRVESLASGTHAEVLTLRAEFLTLRADFRELKHALGEHLPALKT